MAGHPARPDPEKVAPFRSPGFAHITFIIRIAGCVKTRPNAATLRAAFTLIRAPFRECPLDGGQWGPERGYSEEYINAPLLFAECTAARLLLANESTNRIVTIPVYLFSQCLGKIFSRKNRGNVIDTFRDSLHESLSSSVS